MLSALPALIGMAAVGVLLVLACRVSLCPTYPQAIVVSSLAAVVYAGLSAEILSLFDAFSFTGILAAWSVLVLLLAALLARRRESIAGPELDLDTGEKAVYAGVGLLFLLTFLTGFMVAPNNWDSLTYHLSRASHWLHQGGLGFFPTSEPRENVMVPLADIVLAHFLAIEPRAHLAFVGQWVAGISVVTAVGLLAAYLYRSRSATAFAVMTAATVPMLLSQMSTTQADLIASIPIASAVVAWLWMKSGRITAGMILLAVSTSAAVAIKATTALFLVPVCAFFAVWLARRRAWRPLLLGACAAAGSVIVMNIGYALRMVGGMGDVESAASGVFNARLGMEITGVNIIRDLLSMLATPVAPLNRALEFTGNAVADSLGWNLQLPEATFGPLFYLGQAWTEDHAGAPWHLALIAAAVVFMVLKWRKEPHSRSAWLVAILASAFILLAMAIRWQPWINRFSFPVIVFAAPLAGMFIGRCTRKVQSLAAGLLLVLGTAWVLFQPLRGLVGTSWMPASMPLADSIPRYPSPLTQDRFTQLFMHHPGSAEVYADALDHAASLEPDHVTLKIAADWWEYPVWYGLTARNLDAAVSHVPPEVTGASPRGEEHTIVNICIGPCDTDSLADVRFFRNEGASTASVDRGHSLTVGRSSPPDQ